MPLFEQYVTIACVSNKVGDDLIGNALWTGVDLREVLDMAGVRPEGEQIVGRSVDGFTAGFPTSWAMDPAAQADDRHRHERPAAAASTTATRRASSSPGSTATSAPPSG